MASHAPVTTSNPARLFALVAPILVVGAAYGLWSIGDRLLYVGPLDRAQFGWLVVVPVLLAAPVLAGFVWSGLTRGQAAGAALIAATAVGLIAALLFWTSMISPSCETGSRFVPADWIGPSLVLGALVGTGLGASGYVSAELRREGRRIAAVVAAIGIDLLILAVTLVALGAMLITPLCERPTPIG